MKYYPNNKSNSYKVLLPATLDLQGTWEVAIVNIQYPFYWPNFNEEFRAFMVSVMESEVKTKKQKTQKETGDRPLAYFKAQCPLWSMQLPLDPSAKKLHDNFNEYAKQIGRESNGTKLMKIPTGYYDSPDSLGQYLENEFARNLPIKDHEERSAFQIHSLYDNVTQKISFSTKSIVDFRMIPLNERFNAHIGAVCTPGDNKILTTYPNCFGVRRAFLHKYTTMYIYCGAV